MKSRVSVLPPAAHWNHFDLRFPHLLPQYSTALCLAALKGEMPNVKMYRYV